MALTKKLGVRASGSSTIGANGIGDVVLNGPPRGYIEIDTVQVTCTPTAPLPTCNAYEGSSAALGREAGFVRAGDAGTFRGGGDRLNAGSQLTFRWTGGPVGAAIRAVLRGTEYS